jgi:archaemetzincin
LHIVLGRFKIILVSVGVFMATFPTIVFKQPATEERLKAIGPANALPPPLQRALAIEDFAPLPAPGPHDWLAVHPEPDQTFEEFRRGEPNRPDEQRRVIYLQPLGNFPERQSPSTEMLRQYAAAFFQMELKILPPVNIVPGDFTTRTNRTTNRRQILTRDVLRWLQWHSPEDAFCLLGITMEDLYPNPSWNFVFDEASLFERVGVYSFARYDSAFYGGAQESDYQKLLLWRSAKVLTHETAHYPEFRTIQGNLEVRAPNPLLTGLGPASVCRLLGIVPSSTRGP